MPVFDFFIDIFIRQINAARKANPAIYYRYFTVITAIMPYGKRRPERVKSNSFDTVFF